MAGDIAMVPLVHRLKSQQEGWGGGARGGAFALPPEARRVVGARQNGALAHIKALGNTVMVYYSTSQF